MQPVSGFPPHQNAGKERTRLNSLGFADFPVCAGLAACGFEHLRRTGTHRKSPRKSHGRATGGPLGHAKAHDRFDFGGGIISHLREDSGAFYIYRDPQAPSREPADPYHESLSSKRSLTIPGVTYVFFEASRAACV
jgi:hypothetical protein